MFWMKSWLPWFWMFIRCWKFYSLYSGMSLMWTFHSGSLPCLPTWSSISILAFWLVKTCLLAWRSFNQIPWSIHLLHPLGGRPIQIYSTANIKFIRSTIHLLLTIDQVGFVFCPIVFIYSIFVFHFIFSHLTHLAIRVTHEFLIITAL